MGGVYIHIPFCQQKCHYCNFHFSTSFLKKKDLIRAINKELELQKNFFYKETVSSVYLGGGTPSVLKEREIHTIFQTIKKHYSLDDSLEITFEANPENLTTEYIKMLKKTQVNRLSIGVQSFFDKDLIFLNRSHNSQQAEQAIIKAKEEGFKNLTIDLIYGIPTLTEPNWIFNLNQIKKLEINHFSAYALTVEKKTALYQRIKKGIEKPLENKKIVKHFKKLQSFTTKNQYDQYEISNFCKSGYIGKHNSSYWKREKYLGVGPSAHSYDKKKRYWNVSDNNEYINMISKNKLPQKKEILTLSNHFNEYVLTRLRTKWGCNYYFILDTFGEQYFNHIVAKKEELRKKGFFIKNNNNVILSKKGMLYADLITRTFFYEDKN